jgi:hypothetical protein
MAIIDRRYDSFDGGSVRCKAVTYTSAEEMRTEIHASNGIRNHEPNIRTSEDNSCLRPRGQCDRLSSGSKFNTGGAHTDGDLIGPAFFVKGGNLIKNLSFTHSNLFLYKNVCCYVINVDNIKSWYSAWQVNI